MNRRQMREQAFYLVFESLFNSGDNMDELIELYDENVEKVCTYAKEVLSGVTQKRDDIVSIINTYSKSWKVERLPKTTLAILMLAIFEMDFVETVPTNVAINEAVELAKKFSSKNDASFINGILGAYSRSKD